MRKLSKTVEIHICAFAELDSIDQDLIANATSARINAQAPYSNYWVGAAVRSMNACVYGGCNVERASYTQTTHAEQAAIDNMVAEEGSVAIETIAIVGGPAKQIIEFDGKGKLTRRISRFEDLPAPSCGHCLQIIWENCYGNRDVRLLTVAKTGEIVIATIGDALTLPFGPADLGVDYAKYNAKKTGR